MGGSGGASLIADTALSVADEAQQSNGDKHVNGIVPLLRSLLAGWLLISYFLPNASAYNLGFLDIGPGLAIADDTLLNKLLLSLGVALAWLSYSVFAKVTKHAAVVWWLLALYLGILAVSDIRASHRSVQSLLCLTLLLDFGVGLV